MARKNKKSSNSSNSSNSGKSNSSRSSSNDVSGFKKNEIFRIGITYIITFIISLFLLFSNYSSEYKDSLGFIIFTSILFFIICGVYDYFWLNNYLSINRPTTNTDNRTMFHKILHILLPSIILLMGYTILISGFKTSFMINDNKSLSLFFIKFVSLIIIITAYIYYTIKLIKDINNNNNETDTQIDIMYSILHPVSILLISFIFYILILIMNKARIGVQQGVTVPTPQPALPSNPVINN